MTRPDGLRRLPDGDLVEDHDGAPPPTGCPPACRSGWVGEDAAGRPVPCPACRGRRLAERRAAEADPAAIPPPPGLRALVAAARQTTTDPHGPDTPTHRLTGGTP